MTNIERARQMTDVQFYEAFGTCCCPPGADVYELCFNEDGEWLVDQHDCKACWLRWLNKEAEE